MFVKKERLYPEPRCYLKHKEFKAYALAAPADDVTGWIQLPMPEDLSVKVEERLDENRRVIGYRLLFIDRLFVIEVSKIEYDVIKQEVIGRRYTNDAQLAIILNKDKSEEKLKEYNRMQGWRDFAADLAKQAVEAYTKPIVSYE